MRKQKETKNETHEQKKALCYLFSNMYKKHTNRTIICYGIDSIIMCLCLVVFIFHTFSRSCSYISIFFYVLLLYSVT